MLESQTNLGALYCLNKFEKNNDEQKKRVNQVEQSTETEHLMILLPQVRSETPVSLDQNHKGENQNLFSPRDQALDLCLSPSKTPFPPNGVSFFCL